MISVSIPSPWATMARSIGVWASQRNISVWAVGGCVRDWILERPTKDLDLVVEKDWEKVVRFCSNKWGGTLETFNQFKTARLQLHHGVHLDFARTRSEVYPKPAMLPKVSFTPLQKDLLRRDFTINAMAVSLHPSQWGNLVDPTGGYADLKKGILRILHPNSFRDDPTRLWRVARFLCRFKFRLEKETAEKMKEALKAGYPELLSRERIRGELLRILEEKDPACPFRKLKDLGLISLFHPQFDWNPSDFETADSQVRLGLLCLKMGDSGKSFLKSLHLERPVSQSIQMAFQVLQERASPRVEIPALARDILVAYAPSTSPTALSPLCVSGRDLAELGVPEGKEYSVLLNQAAQAQWKGIFSNRSGGLQWLRRRIKNRHSPSE
ncbi:MAG: CCA tRNA nucleotidyltransferase [Elusimicrobia bacterium]|nr:CCA tRNA nucleotidyltransferase [Elusimicrobiota bacterium]